MSDSCEACGDIEQHGHHPDVEKGSIWKRKPPHREVVRVGRVWFMQPTFITASTGEYGWTVRVHPVRGGKALVAALDWFTENFDVVQ